MTNLYSGLRFTCSITKAIIFAILIFAICHNVTHALVVSAVVIVAISLLFLIVLHIINGFEGIRSNTPAIIDVILLGIVFILTIPELALIGCAAWSQIYAAYVGCAYLYEPAFVGDIVCLCATIALICCHLFLSQETS